jgi:alpha-L-rhamnosidase
MMCYLIPALGYTQKLSTKDLTVEHLANPLSVDNPQPRFSWKLVSAQQNTMQTEFEIRLGTDPSFKGTSVYTIKENAETSVLVKYNGPALTSKTKYFWQLRVKDNHGNSSVNG